MHIQITNRCLIAAAAFAVATMQAAITWGPWTESLAGLSGSANWSGTPDPETTSPVSPFGFWSVSLTFSSTAKSYAVVLDGQHLVAPHASDSAPGDLIELGLLVPMGTGIGQVQGLIPHTPGDSLPPDPWQNADNHADAWYLTVTPGSVLNVQFYASHWIPEPGLYAWVAGVGLLGFAASRRFLR